MSRKLIIVCILAISLGIVLSNSKFLGNSAGEDKQKIIDSLKDYTRDNLVKLALAGDDYQRSKLPPAILILRGLREFIDRLSNDELKGVIANQIIDSKGEVTLDSLKQLANISLSVKDNEILGFLNSIDVDHLTKIALGMEIYSRKKMGKENLIGGLNDYIRFLEKNDIIKIIQDSIAQYPELGQSELLVALSDSNLLTLNEIHAQLIKETTESLAKMAIVCESYEREKKNIHVFGGIHDYAFRLTKEELIPIIETFVQENPELAIKNKLQLLVGNEQKKSFPILGGIEDYLKDFSLEELKSMALEAEKYDIEKNGFRLGGLHDYINSLNKDQVLSIVINYVMSFNELRAPGVLEQRAGINKGGLVGILREKSIDSLKEICLCLENYDRKKTGIELDGGLHDYIDRLNLDDLVEYIQKMTNKYTEGIKIGGLQTIMKSCLAPTLM